MRENTEGVGLEMALQEKHWLLDRFSFETEEGGAASLTRGPFVAPTPAKSQLGTSRLTDHRRGLRLATSPEDLGLVPRSKSTYA